MFMFFYQFFDSVQLIRGEAVISRERHRADPEFGFVPAAGDVDMGGLVPFVAVELEAIAASRNLNCRHGIKMPAAS
jgi:hypothetical protein